MADNKNKEKKHFFKGLKSELKKVIWPTSKQVTNNTIAVITLVVVVTVVVLALDFCLKQIDDLAINKLRTKYTNTQVLNTQNTSENTDETTDENSTTDNTTEVDLSQDGTSEVIVE